MLNSLAKNAKLLIKIASHVQITTQLYVHNALKTITLTKIQHAQNVLKTAKPVEVQIIVMFVQRDIICLKIQTNIQEIVLNVILIVKPVLIILRTV